MIVEKINKKNLPLRVLLSPLDWGLGHATRCIPIINVLIEHDIEVYIAAEGLVAELLQNEYPAIVILPLKGYQIKYSRTSRLFFLKMLAQFPKIIASINHEKKWLNKIVKDHHIDAVISDNRFGLYLEKTPCIYVTHQLFIQTGNKLLNRIAQKINYHFINKFDECWVPDIAGAGNLAGELSHPQKFPLIPVNYIGTLSRCKKIAAEKKYHLLIMLSGPEPQRAIFENILLVQLKKIPGKIIVVRGLPGEKNGLSAENKDVIIYNHLPAEKLNELIQQSENIIARCGYSTIMDLVTLQRNAILVATPGQTEQEYLAVSLREKKIFFTCQQENFSLEQALEAFRKFDFATTKTGGIQDNIIADWIHRLKKDLRTSQ